jgi:hypothetical protein
VTNLTREVAALDATEKGHTSLASYDTQRGETPGWVGSGLDGIDGLTTSDLRSYQRATPSPPRSVPINR